MFLIYNNHLKVDAYDPWKSHSDPSIGLEEDRRQTLRQTDRQTHRQILDGIVSKLPN